jgi:glycosyltransferase involved in cell wall biosynthesis
MASPPLTVAWISDFPVEWLDDLPPELAALPRAHPLTWQRVLLEEFAARPGVALHVIVLRKGIPRDVTFTRGRAQFHVLRTRAFTRAPTLFWSDTFLVRRKLRALGPDLVHAWGTERGAALVGLRCGWPCLITIQGLMTWYREAVPLNRHEQLAARLEEFTLRRAKIVTTESGFAVKFLQGRHPRLDVRQVEHAPGRRFHELNRAPQPDPPRLLFTGRLDQRKGGDVLFEALNRLAERRDFEFVQVGSADEDLLAEARRKTSPQLWQRIHLRGSLPSSEVASELGRATLLVLPTRADTSPNAVKEAVVAGVPVVATSIGGIPDYVFPGENGLLIPAAEPQSLTNALDEALCHPLFGRGEVRETTLARVRDYLSPARMADGFLAAYRRTLGRD